MTTALDNAPAPASAGDSLARYATQADLDRLLQGAYLAVHSQGDETDERRQSPRVAVDDVRPLLIDAYVYEGREHRVRRGCKIADVSADGLGILFDEPIPRGASLRFVFADESARRRSGYATVVCAMARDRGYRIGLRFADASHGSDTTERPAPSATSAPSATPPPPSAASTPAPSTPAISPEHAVSHPTDSWRARLRRGFRRFCAAIGLFYRPPSLRRRWPIA